METDSVKAGEIIQSVKCPLGKHDNLSSIPSIYIEKQVVVAYTVILALGR